MSINVVSISGNLTRNAELRVTKGGTNVLTFGMAVNDRRKNPQTGEWEDSPNFIDCCLFGPRAEKLSGMLSKGIKVCVFGKLRWSQWESNGQKRSKVEVVVDDIEIMGRSNVHNQEQSQDSNNYPYSQGNAPNSSSHGRQEGHSGDLYDTDIPF